MKKYLLVVLMCFLLLTGCSNKDDGNIEKNKVLTELDYLSSKIADMLNNLNNISLENYELVSKKISADNTSKGEGSNQASSSSSSGKEGEQEGQSAQEEQEITVTEMRNNSILNTDTENINWDYMRREIENVNNSWNVVMLDLYNNKISNDDIMAFGDNLNKTIISIKNEDKQNTLTNLGKLYSYIPTFFKTILGEDNKQKVESTKYYLFTAYIAVSLDDWNIANENLLNAENEFLSVLNNIDYSNNREYKVNKTYMLIKDLQACVTSNDKSLFLLKYKSLIESINTL